MPMLARKKKVVKAKPVVKTLIQEELSLFIDELPDIEVPEPVPGSPFIRRGFVECISDVGYETLLTLGRTYTVNELHLDGDKLQISCDDGDSHWITDKHFKAIDYGPFRIHDQVSCMGYEGVTSIKGSLEPALLDQHGIVTEGNDTHAIVQWGSNFKFSIPNENLRLKKRHLQLGKNPFQSGDRVRCIKQHHDNVIVECVYTIQDAYDDYVHIREDDQGRKYYHNIFVKYDRLSKKDRLKLKAQASLTLEDYVRKFYNEYSYDKLTPAKLIKHMRDSKVSKELLNEDEIMKVLKKINKTVFHW